VAEAQTSSKKGLTRGKAILIGILSVVLVVVLYLQFGRGGEKPVSAAANYRPPRTALAVQPVSAPTNQVTLASAKSPANSQSNKAKDAAAALLIDGTKWKSPKLETIVAYDPFALPPTFPQLPKVANGAKGKDGKSLIAAAAADDAKRLAEAVEKLHMELEELKQRGVHVILRDGDQYVAWIGERMLHVGDKINDFTVTAIDTDGVHIERIDSP
jgi:hypothetical protein